MTTNLDQYRAYWTARFAQQSVDSVITHRTPEEHIDYYRPIFAVVAPAAPTLVFDIGCGSGMLYPLVRELWPACAYVGVDLMPEALQLAQERYGQDDHTAWLLSRDVVPAAFPEPVCDFIMVHSVMTHIYPVDAVTLLDNIRASLAPAGRASISIHMCDAGVQGNIHTIRYAPPLFEAMVAQAGLRIVAQVDGQLPPTAGPQRYYACERCEA